MLYELLSRSCVGCDLCASRCPWYPVFKPSQRNRGLRKAVESCTMCGNCILGCPLKVPTHKAVYERKAKGMIPKDLEAIRDEVKERGSTFGVEMDWNNLKEYPLDERAEWLLLPGGFDSLPTSRNDFVALLWTLRELGTDFTLSREVPEGFGNFYFDYAEPQYFKRKVVSIIKVAKMLGVKGLLLSECGADYKVWPRVANYLKVKHDLKVEIAINIISNKLRSRHVVRKLPWKTSYHDPCGLSRYNFLTEPPRKLLKTISENYEERGPGGRDQICCGGGGGVSFSETWKRRAVEVVGHKKVRQFRGIEVVTTACAKCKSMLLSYSLLLGGGFRVHRLGYLVAWSMGMPLPPP